MSDVSTESAVPSTGFVEDIVTGLQVRATPEEVEAVQVYARRLIEDYGYPREHLQTRPQYRVSANPSKSQTYPVDIALFADGDHKSDDLLMIVECKRKTTKDGLRQLQTYLSMSAAQLGIWFNGDDQEILHKVFDKKGRMTFESLTDIPRFGQAISDIGRNLRRDLKPASNLRAVFRQLRNHLAGNAPGITRDEALASEIINLLFCKLYDEVDKGPDDTVDFRHGIDEDPSDVAKRIKDLFENVKIDYPDVFESDERLKLDPKSLAYVVGSLQNYCLSIADRDAIGDAFEVFIGPTLRGPEGQFFTPRNVVRALVEMVDPKPGELIIDPACGSGGFLTVALEHVWLKTEAEGKQKGWSEGIVERKKKDIATNTFRGMDKDAFLARCTKAYLAILGDGRGGVFRVDSSLQRPEEWPGVIQEKIQLGTFDVVLTNPPFGKKIRISERETLEQFDLGHKWDSVPGGNKTLSDEIAADQAPQLLFLERSLQLLKPGGRLGIVLPESIFGSPSYSHIVAWMQDKAAVLAIAAMPEALFKTSGKVGTHTKVCILVLQKKGGNKGSVAAPIFMADAKWCGHDSRGNETTRVSSDGTKKLLDDVPVIAERYAQYHRGKGITEDHLGFLLPQKTLVNSILVPKYYDPEISAQLNALASTHEIITLGELVADGHASIATGVEVGKMAYGTGAIPFIRTSDISNWELKADPKQGVSEDIYEALKAKHPEKFDVRPGDIFVVKDGTYLVGTSAVATEYDMRILYQSHLYKVRIYPQDIIDPWLFFASFNSPIVKRQIRSKRFTQDIIDTLGNRITELKIPVPRDGEVRKRIAREMESAITTRARLREQAKHLALEIEGSFAEDDLDQLEEVE